MSAGFTRLLALAAFLGCLCSILSASAQIADPLEQAPELTLEDPTTRRTFRRRVAGGATLGFVVGAAIVAGTVGGIYSTRVSGGVGIALVTLLPAVTMTLALSTGVLLGRTVRPIQFGRAVAASALGVLAGGIALTPFVFTLNVDGGGVILLAGSAVAALAMVVTTTLFTVRIVRRAEQAHISVRAGLGSVSIAAAF